jgi:hypothetical protein
MAESAFARFIRPARRRGNLAIVGSIPKQQTELVGIIWWSVLFVRDEKPFDAARHRPPTSLR